MKKYLFICLLSIFFNCKNQQERNIPDSKKNKDEGAIEVKDSLFFNSEGKIIVISHFENNIREGFSLILDENTNYPKYLVEYNEGKRDKVIIAFDSNGKIESLRSADIHSDSQKMKFHENGVIKSIGNTVKGRGEGIWYYFDKEGKLVKEVVYEKGQVID